MHEVIKVCHFNVEEFILHEYRQKLQLLPVPLQMEISQYRFCKDRLVRLAARLIVLRELLQTSDGDKLANWKRDKQNKPSIPQWRNFSISHSENLVVVAFASNILVSVGVDVELAKNTLPFEPSPMFFSSFEIDKIKASTDRAKTFYSIWIKKEALLKATGEGIVGSPSQVTCLLDNIIYHECYWSFSPLDIHHDYMAYLAFNKPSNIIIHKIHMDDLP